MTKTEWQKVNCLPCGTIRFCVVKRSKVSCDHENYSTLSLAKVGRQVYDEEHEELSLFEEALSIIWRSSFN